MVGVLPPLVGEYRMLVAAILTLLACDSTPAQEPPAAPAPSTPTTHADADPAPAPHGGGSGGSTDGGGALPDVSGDMRGGQCGNGPGAEGADSYFLGQFAVSGGQVTGEERWQLYANEKWKARGGRDCTITWRITGQQVSDTGACGRCDLAVRFHASADISGSNCPEELVKGRLLPNGQRAGGEAQDFDNTYAVERKPDGSARIYFAKSGKLLGEGYHNASGFNYVSDHACKWF